MHPHKLALLSCTVTLLGLTAVGCGSTTPTSTGGSAATRGPAAGAYAYARCMRSHGVSGFPDPVVKTTSTSASVSQVAPASVASSPAYKSADKACAHLQNAAQSSGQASGGPSKSVLLAFARCLRAHGIKNFPDPSGQGRLSLTTISAAGVNVHTPAFFKAGRECVAVTHGAITVAQVAALVNHTQ